MVPAYRSPAGRQLLQNFTRATRGDKTATVPSLQGGSLMAHPLLFGLLGAFVVSRLLLRRRWRHAHLGCARFSGGPIDLGAPDEERRFPPWGRAARRRRRWQRGQDEAGSPERRPRRRRRLARAQPAAARDLRRRRGQGPRPARRARARRRARHPRTRAVRSPRARSARQRGRARRRPRAPPLQLAARAARPAARRRQRLSIVALYPPEYAEFATGPLGPSREVI